MTTKGQPLKPHRFLLLAKKLSISIAIICVVTMLQFYWSMGELSDRMSSGCMSCSFFEDAIFMSFFTGILLSVVFSLLGFIQKIAIRAVIEFLSLIFLWGLWNHSIFVDRESSWSTYDLRTEIHYTLSLSFVPAIILGCVCLILLHLKEIKTRIPAFK